MKRKVFGVGLNKTGSKTLAACLRQLGFNHLDYCERTVTDFLAGDMASVWAAADRHDSSDDWPWPLLYRELAERYRDARFVLTVRKSADIWLSSLVKHAHRLELYDRIDEAIYGYRYPENAPAHYKAIYERHNHEAMQFLGERCRPLCWEDGDSWPELCSFLEEELPQVPLPFENRAWQPPVDHRIATALQCKLEQAKLARRARMGREMPKGLLA